MKLGLLRLMLGLTLGSCLGEDSGINRAGLTVASAATQDIR